MILFAFLALIVVGMGLAVADWRKGMFALIIVGLLQDPLRKVIPGAPGYLVLSTVPIWLAIVLRMIMTRSRTGRLADVYPVLGASVTVFLISLLPAALVSATYGPGSWQLTILGAFTYLSLLFSVQIGYRFSRDVAELRRLIGFYCVAVAVALTGTMLEYLRIPFPALGTEALGTVWVRHIWGTAVYMVAGFFRSPDIMGWHGALAAMLSLTLAMSGRKTGRWFWLALAVWGSTLVILCGRRKMVYMLPFFVIAATILFNFTGKKIRIVSVVGVVLLAMGGVAIIYQQAEIDSSFMTYYSDKPADVFAQVERHGFDSLVVTIRQSGFFGEGLGSASTGAHHLNVPRPRVWQESGPSRLLVELGLPGFLGFIVMAFLTLHSIWKVFRERLPRTSPHVVLWVGLFSILLANGGAFLVSGQIFGDPFITCLIATLVGAVLSSLRLERMGARRKVDEGTVEASSRHRRLTGPGVVPSAR